MSLGATEIVGQAINWQELFINLGAFGLVAWIVVHLYKVLLPGLTKAFSEALEANRLLFAKEQQDSRISFAAEVNAARAAHAQEQQDSRHEWKNTVNQIMAQFNEREAQFREELKEIRKEHAETIARITAEHMRIIGEYKKNG